MQLVNPLSLTNHWYFYFQQFDFIYLDLIMKSERITYEYYHNYKIVKIKTNLSKKNLVKSLYGDSLTLTYFNECLLVLLY